MLHTTDGYNLVQKLCKPVVRVGQLLDSQFCAVRKNALCDHVISMNRILDSFFLTNYYVTFYTIDFRYSKILQINHRPKWKLYLVHNTKATLAQPHVWREIFSSYLQLSIRVQVWLNFIFRKF
jgi:hypothetical protein